MEAFLFGICDAKHRFYREGGGWYIDLSEYLEQGSSKADLAMVAGTDIMLDTVAGINKSVTLVMDTKPFEDADTLLLKELCAPAIGGAYYLLEKFEGRAVHQQMWLCGVTEFVFGCMPQQIYLKRIVGSEE